MSKRFLLSARGKYLKSMKTLFGLTALLICLCVLWPSVGLAQSLQRAESLYNEGAAIERKAASKQDLEKALRMYEEALVVFERHGSDMWTGATLNRIGIVYSYWDEHEKTLDYCKRALNIGNRIRFANLQAASLNELGAVYFQQGDFNTALQYFEQMLQLCKKNPGALQGVFLSNVGHVYEVWGQYRKALEYFEECLAVAKKKGESRDQGIALRSIAQVYREWGQYERAEQSLKTALDSFKKAQHPIGEISTLRELGFLCQGQGKFEKAIGYFQDALALESRIGGQTHFDKSLIGNAYLDMGQVRLAEPYIREADIIFSMGRLYLAKDDYTGAKHYYEMLLKSDRVDDKFAAYAGLGKVYESLEDYKSAEQYYEKGMKLTEEIRSGLMPAERKNFLEVKVKGFARSEPAQGLTRVRVKFNQAANSIDSSEVTRARAFSDNIAQKSATGYVGVPRELLDKEDSLVIKVASLKKELAKTEKEVNPDRYENMNRELQKAEAALNSFVQMLWENYKPYASVKYPRPVTLKESALRPEEYVVIFDVSGEGVGVKLVKGTEIAQTFYTKWKAEDLDRDVKKFRRAFEAINLKEFDPELGRNLYKKLLGAVLMHVPEGTPLVIIPDGILAVLPFEALVVSGKPSWREERDSPYPDGLTYVVDVYPVSYYQSITALSLARTLRSQTPGTKTLVVADPVFEPTDPRVQKAYRSEQQKLLADLPETLMSIKNQTGFVFSRLPQTAELAESLKRINPDKTVLFTGIQAKKSILFGKPLTDYGYIVFATHGYFGKDIPGIQEPVLAMTLVDQLKGQDGFLRMSEVMGMNLNAHVVALTACQSGLGSNLSGEGIMSMGRAFQYAGARSVLMSLWSVSESASVLLVEKFFEHLNAGKNKLEALQLARDDVRNAGYRHPFFWAPFILVGEVD